MLDTKNFWKNLFIIRFWVQDEFWVLLSMVCTKTKNFCFSLFFNFFGEKRKINLASQPIRGLVSNWLMFPKHLCFQNTCTWSGPRLEKFQKGIWFLKILPAKNWYFQQHMGVGLFSFSPKNLRKFFVFTKNENAKKMQTIVGSSEWLKNWFRFCNIQHSLVKIRNPNPKYENDF